MTYCDAGGHEVADGTPMERYTGDRRYLACPTCIAAMHEHARLHPPSEDPPCPEPVASEVISMPSKSRRAVSRRRRR